MFETPEQKIARIYSTLFRVWGRQHWWPAQSRFEVIVGAYLTQNTNWSNVELAMKKLRSARVLSLEGIRRTPIRKLEQLIRSSGYFRQKASRLKLFVQFLDENYGGSLTRMFAQPTLKLREQLLALNGVGPETADSILLYAGQHPIFVVDAYTRRLALRHEIASEKATYEELRAVFERGLAEHAATAKGPREAAAQNNSTFVRPKGTSHDPSRMSLADRDSKAQVFNEMHGLIVGVGKNYCSKSQPKCDECPLKYLLPSKPHASHTLL
jgi:endonuclease-3 related protein